jgi:hypothetical protein
MNIPACAACGACATTRGGTSFHTPTAAQKVAQSQANTEVKALNACK